MGYFSEFEEYDVILETTDSLSDTYNHINRNTKRNINECLDLGITLHKATPNDLAVFYDIVKKKTKKKYSFYESIMNIYNNKDNQAELYFAKINPHEYLINAKNRYESYHIKNEKIHRVFTRHIGNVSDRLLNKKINSDKTLEKYRNQLKEAIQLDQHYKEDIIIGTSMIIRNNHEVYFLIDGYKEEFRHMHGTHILKWAIIKKYHEQGYRIFNLGEIHNTYYNKNSFYYNQYKYKISFGGNVINYTPNLIYIINKPIFRLFQKVNRKH
jgi:lipid II:glycine glycyltransferase (peptidoglycan interpeptide bridge formation enzyme)